MNKELMQQALDALENSIDCVEMEYTTAVKRYGGIPSREKQLLCIKEYVDDHKDAIAALEYALAQPVPKTAKDKL